MARVSSVARIIAYHTMAFVMCVAGCGDGRDADDERRGEEREATVRARVTPRGDAVDWHAAVAQRDRLPPARIAGASPEALYPTWQYIGPSSFGTSTSDYQAGRINAVSFDPSNRSTLYAGAPWGGLWKTTDAGAHWTALGDRWDVPAVSAVAVDPSNGQSLWIGTGDVPARFGPLRTGVLHSSDGGQMFTNPLGAAIGGLPGFAVSRIVLDPDDPQVILAAVVFDSRLTATTGFVYRSGDGGAHWQRVIADANGALVQANWTDLAVGVADLTRRRYLYAIAESVGGQVWRSEDHGATWTRVAAPFAAVAQVGLKIAASPVYTPRVYALSTVDRRVFASVDAGQSWSDITDGDLASSGWESYGGYNGSLAVSSVNSTGWSTGQDVVYAGVKDLFQRSDGGTWKYLPQTHADQHALAVSPFDATQILVGNDGGAWFAKRDAATALVTVTSLNQYLGVGELYAVTVAPGDANYILAGEQDTGNPLATDNLAAWRQAGGQDGTGVAIHPLNRNIQFTQQNWFVTDGSRRMERTGDAWATRDSITPPVGSEPGDVLTAVAWNPQNPDQLYVATNHLYRFDDLVFRGLSDKTQYAAAWTRSGQVLGNQVKEIAVGADGSRIYTASLDGQVWMSTNGGTSFTQVNGDLAAANFNGLSVNPGNADDVLIGVSSSSVSSAVEVLFRCTNPRASSPTWTKVSGTGTQLPRAGVNTIARDPGDPTNSWYVGMDVGVFYTRDAGATWANATAPLGLPNVPVEALTAASGWLYAGTYGRGLWRARLGCTPTTCAAAGAQCGAIADGCGGTLDCGSCPTGATCGAAVANQCCQPATCASLGTNCGTPPDGCGGRLTCGTCTAPSFCGGGGAPYVCGTCTPRRCRTGQCGTFDDGCGNQICCGTSRCCF